MANDKGFRVNIKDMVDKETVSLLKKAAKGIKQYEKLAKTSQAVGNVGTKSDQRIIENMRSMHESLKLMQASIESNKAAISSVNEIDLANKVSASIEAGMSKIVEAIKTGNLSLAKSAANESSKASKEAKILQSKVAELNIPVTEVVKSVHTILHNDDISLHTQKTSMENLVSVLKEEGYKNEDMLKDLMMAIANGNKKQLKVALESLQLDKQNYESMRTSTKRSQHALQQIVDVNTELLEKAQEQTLREMIESKFKKQHEFARTDTGKTLSGLLGAAAGVPGLSLILEPLLDIAGLFGAKKIYDILKNTKIKDVLKGGGARIGKGVLSGAGKIRKFGAAGKLAKGAGVGISGLLTGMFNYMEYQDAVEAGASPEELSKLKRKGIGGTVGNVLGTIAGGALGSFVGPGGTVAGGIAGGIAGEKIGEWFAGLDSIFGEDGMISKIVTFFKSISETKWFKYIVAVMSGGVGIGGAISLGKTVVDSFASPQPEKKEMDNSAYQADRRLFNMEKEAMKPRENPPSIVPTTPPSNSMPKPIMNNSPVIDDPYLSILNLGMMEA